jgi:tetratricopeptide (TPR) repeat protein
MKRFDESPLFYNEVIKLVDLDDEAAIKTIKKNIDTLKKTDDIALAYLNCAFLNHKLGDYISAIEDFSKTIEFEVELKNFNKISKDISLNGRSNAKYQSLDYKGAIEDKRKAKKITLVETEKTSGLDFIRIDYKNILLGTFVEIELESSYKTLIKVSKIKKSKYDLIADYKKVISKKRKEEVIRKLELLSEEKYKVGDYKGSIKAIRRAEKYY